MAEQDAQATTRDRDRSGSRSGQQQTLHGLESRIAKISPQQMAATETLPALLTALAGRGYNTIALPLLEAGTVNVRVHGDGRLAQRGTCSFRDALMVAEDFPLTVLLYFDPLSAGPAGGERLGALASQHRQWLMKNAQGKTKIFDFPELPALFCWTTIDYRRYLGNLLVELAESQRFDGLLIDLRRVPKSTEKPKTWTHLGYSSLQRIQRELGVDLESFLNQPTIETLRAIELWRLEQLLRFIENIKARIHEVRQPILTAFLAYARRNDGPFVPWIDAYNHGLIEELFLDAPPDRFGKDMEYVDTLLSESRPWIGVLETEGELSIADEALTQRSSCGYLVQQPDAEAEEPLAGNGLVWELHGAMEVAPVSAVRAIISQTLPMLRETPRLMEFFEKLILPLDTFGEAIRSEEVFQFRKDLQKIYRKMRDGDFPASFPRAEVQRRINLMIRLLQLAPFHPVDF